MACPPNANLPTEIWLAIMYFLPADDITRLRHLNATFWDRALDLMYSTLTITHYNLGGIIGHLRFYSKPFVAPRVKRVCVDKSFVRFVTKRPAWIPVLDSLIPLLKNVTELVLYPIHRDKSSLGMAKEFSRKRFSLPALRELKVNYSTWTRNIWHPVVRRMIYQSSELETLHIGYFWDQNSSVDSGEPVSVIPTGPPAAHPRLSFVRLADRKILEVPGTIEFLYDYRFQLRALDVGFLTDRMIPRLSGFSVLSSLWACTQTEALYFKLVDVLSEISSLRELHIHTTGVNFSAHDPTSTFPPIPNMPLLEKISLKTMDFDLFNFYRFATSLPSLRCMTIHPLRFSKLTCGSQAELSTQSLVEVWFGRYKPTPSGPFCAAVLEMEPVSVPWKLECLFICNHDGGNISADVVDCFPTLVPSLTGNKEFYWDWRQIRHSYHEFVPSASSTCM
ncbi:hypothetical protein DL96DRAFT_1629861 [Flagelloscypha sp. PMI_526]|nr:hypothetical protein DL96DRAFT_1629861 [Flagelloscypha sp. PMI_526]